MKLPFQFFTPFRSSLLSLALSASCVLPAYAIESFQVKDIRVEGAQRIEVGTIFNYLGIRSGDTVNDQTATEAIKALYQTGFFNDVQLEKDHEILIVKVVERPAIASINYVGIKEFQKEQLNAALKGINVAQGRIFDKSVIDRAEQELKKQYLSRGFYAAEIKTTVTPIERNRVTVQFNVTEGNIARIKQIRFIGNQKFSDSQLADLMGSTTPGWLTWYTRSDRYSKQKLSADLETIKSHYLDRGYLEMQIESTQVSISDDKQDIFVTVNIKEGDQFTVSDFKLAGQTFGREEELKKLIQLKNGETFNNAKLVDTQKKIAEWLSNLGYAFASVNATPELDREKKTAAFTLFIDPGKRIYVRRININGNDRTRDVVVRRELRQFENAWYDGERIRLSRDRVDRLGYFKDVDVSNAEVPGVPDQVDLSIDVTEKPTGNLLLGAGFSSSEKLVLTASVQQANAFGSGNTLGFDINTSKTNRTLAISTFDPYFTDDGISRGYDLYLRNSKALQGSVGDYRVQTMGGSIRFGVPFSETDTVFFGIGAERAKISTFANSPLRYRRYVQDFGNGTDATTMSIPLTISWQRDSRDSALVPSKGRYQRANFEISPIGDLRYYRAIYQDQYFWPLSSRIALAFNGEVDYGRGMSGKPYPIFKNFYAGGIGSVRGYESNSLGAKDSLYNDPLGGASRLLGNVELLLPFPGTAGKDRSLRIFAFLDGGNVFDESQKINFGDLRYSTGVGLSWISPVGPLKLSYGVPLNAKPEDSKQRIQFQLGTGF